MAGKRRRSRLAALLLIGGPLAGVYAFADGPALSGSFVTVAAGAGRLFADGSEGAGRLFAEGSESAGRLFAEGSEGAKRLLGAGSARVIRPLVSLAARAEAADVDEVVEAAEEPLAAVDVDAMTRQLGPRFRIEPVAASETGEQGRTSEGEAAAGASSDWTDEEAAEALAADGARQRIIVALDQRRLWLLEGGDTVLTAEVAIGRGTTFKFQGRTYRFETPRGVRRVRAKATDPIWTPPMWHYYEKAAARGLEIVELKDGERHMLEDSTVIEVRDNVVGRVNRRGQWWAWTPGMEIIFDGKIFVPPLASPQRRVPQALGPYKLDLGEGYLIHGTHVYNENSIGQAVSHGCIRMRNQDLEQLYPRVRVGTTVQIL